jgi:CRP/FNR family transcriptional regulator, anaerobic regulatory protein
MALFLIWRGFTLSHSNDEQMIEKAVEAFPCLGFLTPKDCANMEVISVDPGSPHPIQPGHRLQHALFVLQGSVRIYQINEQGREITLYRLKGGECCSLMMCSILGEYEYEASAEIECETELLAVSIPTFKRWIDQQPMLKKRVFKEITSRIIDVTRLVDDLAFQSIAHRLAAFLLKRTESGEHTVVTTHEQLAVELGTAREVVSRGLKELEKQGLLQLSRGRITAMDRDGIEHLLSIVTKSR